MIDLLAFYNFYHFISPSARIFLASQVQQVGREVRWKLENPSASSLQWTNLKQNFNGYVFIFMCS